MLETFQFLDWNCKRKSKQNCKGNIDTFFKHRQSIQPLSVRTGQAMEHTLVRLAQLSTLVHQSELTGTTISDVQTNSSIGGNKQIDNAFFDKENVLFIIEHKSSADMDNKGWAEVILGLSKVAERVGVLINHPIEQIRAVVLCQNDMSDITPKHKYAVNLITKLSDQLPIMVHVKGWDWYFNKIGLNITPEEYYQTIQDIGEMITNDRQWGEWSNPLDLLSF